MRASKALSYRKSLLQSASRVPVRNMELGNRQCGKFAAGAWYTSGHVSTAPNGRRMRLTCPFTGEEDDD